MKIEKTHYVIMKIGNINFGKETAYLSYDSKNEFTNDISVATKFGSEIAARYAKYEFESRKHHGFIQDMHIIPVKCTYEW